MVSSTIVLLAVIVMGIACGITIVGLPRVVLFILVDESS